MDWKQITGLVMGVVIGVLLLTTLAIPVISDATVTEKTFTNEGAFYVEMDPSETDYTIEFDGVNSPGIITVNDEDMEFSFTVGYTILILDDSILRIREGENTLQYKGNNYYITGINTITLTIGNGEVSGTYTTTDVDTPTDFPITAYEKAYLISPDEQDLIMSNYTTPVKMLGDSDIFAFGQTSISNTWYLIRITGTITDGVEVEILDRTTAQPVDGATVTDTSINATAINGYKDLYELTSITFVVTISDTAANVTFSAYIVPTQVTAELSEHLDSSSISLLSIIPLLITVGIIVAVVGLFVIRRE